jgi:hypothetical protein
MQLRGHREGTINLHANEGKKNRNSSPEHYERCGTELMSAPKNWKHNIYSCLEQQKFIVSVVISELRKMGY